MPDLISIANDLKTAPDQWLVQQSQKPSGTTPPYLVLAELHRRQLLRGAGGKPPSSSVAQDTLAATMKQIEPPAPQGPPPPPGMVPPAKGMPSGEPGGPVPGAKPPQNMAKGGMFDDDDDDESTLLPRTQLSKMPVPELIRYFSDHYKLDPRLALTVGQLESNYKTGRVSSEGARGPMQLMPGTFKEMGGRNIDDPVENVRAGVKYLKRQHVKYKGDFEKTLAAYNAGPGAVDKYGGVPPYAETKEYVRRGKLFKPPDRPPREPIKELGYLDTTHLSGTSEPQVPFDRTVDQPILRGDRPDQMMWAAQNVGRWQGPLEAYKKPGDAVRTMEPILPPAISGKPEVMASARGPMEIMQPDASYRTGQIQMPGMPSGLGAAESPMRPKPAGLAGFTLPESEELKLARTRWEEAQKEHKLKIEEGGLENIHKRAKKALGKATDYSKLEAAIEELTQEAEANLHPSIGAVMRNMGFALLSSHKNFGEALGEAGLYASNAWEKQRQEGRANYIAALKAGVDLQAKKGAYSEKLAALELGEQRLTRQEINDARKEAIAAEKDFTRIVGDSPAAQMKERTNAIKQWKAQNNQDPEGPLSDEEQMYVQFGKMPATATKVTLAQKAAAGDTEAQDALDRLNKKQSYDDYISGKKFAQAAAPGAPGALPPAPPPELGQVVPPEISAQRRGTPWMADAGNFNEDVIAKLPPEEQMLVRKIANYDIELSSRTMSNDDWQNRLKAAALYNPDFSQGEYRNRQKLRQKYTSGKGADTINALVTLTEHIDRTEKNWAAFDNWGGWGAAGNRPRNAIRSFFKDPRFGPWALNQEGASTEMMKLWRQAGASTQEIEQWKNALDLNASPEGQAKTISEMYRMIEGKLAAAKKEYESGMGRPMDFHLLTPKVAERFRSHGVDYSDIDTGVDQNPAAPPQKLASKADVQEFAKKKNISYEEAETAFKNKGWTIQ